MVRKKEASVERVPYKKCPIKKISELFRKSTHQRATLLKRDSDTAGLSCELCKINKASLHKK